MAKHSAVSQTKREIRDARRKREMQSNLIKWGSLALVAVLVVGGLVWFFTRPASSSAPMGTVIQVNSRDHVPEGSDPGPYASDPPAGGKHYPVTYNPGFYSEQDVTKLPKLYQGYLVHNLEHGYVIYWYNCNADPKISCSDITNAIQQVIKENNTYKVIGFPWPSLKQPIAMTSWGRLMTLNSADLKTMEAFYKSNVDQAPEKTTE